MPRYVVERTFEDGPWLRSDAAGAEAVGVVVRRNTEEGVTWIHSYVSADGNRAFCLYEGPTPEAIRRAATANELPVDRITQVGILDPYFRI